MFLLAIFLILLGVASAGELCGQLCFLPAKDQLLLNVALVPFVNVRSSLIGLFFESDFNRLGLVPKQFLDGDKKTNKFKL